MKQRITLECLQERLELELERDKLEAQANGSRQQVERLQQKARALESAAQEDRDSKVNQFNQLYTALMRVDERGARLPGHMTAYSASKAGLWALTVGIRADLVCSPGIVASTMLPGYIRTELTARHRSAPFIVDLEPGSRALVRTIEREPARASRLGHGGRSASCCGRCRCGLARLF